MPLCLWITWILWPNLSPFSRICHPFWPNLSPFSRICHLSFLIIFWNTKKKLKFMIRNTRTRKENTRTQEINLVNKNYKLLIYKHIVIYQYIVDSIFDASKNPPNHLFWFLLRVFCPDAPKGSFQKSHDSDWLILRDLYPRCEMVPEISCWGVRHYSGIANLVRFPCRSCERKDWLPL